MAIPSEHTGILDTIDRKILRVLSKDGRITLTALADAVGLSKTPCRARMRRLQKEGYILGYRAVLSPSKMRLEHIAFVEVKLSDTTATSLAAFNAAVQSIPEIEQCHMIAGGFDYLLKVRTTDIIGYRRILGEEISALPFVAQTSTFVAMETVKEQGVLN
jgi:Lrp/AsnC family transcriptional regulator, leucine-responsive regulatory protein